MGNCITYLLAYLLTYLFTYLLTYLLTYIHYLTTSLCCQEYKAEGNRRHPSLSTAILSRSCVFIFWVWGSVGFGGLLGLRVSWVWWSLGFEGLLGLGVSWVWGSLGFEGLLR